MKRVFAVDNVTEAQIVRGLLAASGLDAIVQDEHMAGMGGKMAVVEVWPSVWILDDSAEAEARQIVADYESKRTQPAAAAGTGWRCAQCGQQLEQQFTACWACGAGRSP
jgi:hypothetical protein